MEEKDRIDLIATQTNYSHGINFKMVQFITELAWQKHTGGKFLELGPAEGVGTNILVGYGADLVVVEGSTALSNHLKLKHPNLEVHNTLFESFSPSEKFNTILMSHVLEHVENPEELLQKAKSWLVPQGQIIVGVPNSESIHRKLAVEMGILSKTTDLGDTDIKVGHRRVFSIESLTTLCHSVGLEVIETSGFWLKPLTNAQIEMLDNPTLEDALMKLGSEYPELAAEIVLVLR